MNAIRSYNLNVKNSTEHQGFIKVGHFLESYAITGF
jgi:hypothetical protein